MGEIGRIIPGEQMVESPLSGTSVLLYVISPSLAYPYCPQCLVRAMEVTHGDCASRLCIKFDKNQGEKNSEGQDSGSQWFGGLGPWSLVPIATMEARIMKWRRWLPISWPPRSKESQKGAGIPIALSRVHPS